MQGRQEPRVLRRADVLAHLHRGDRVVAVVQRIPVVLDPDLGPVPEAQAAGALPDVAALLAGQGHAGHLDSGPGRVDGQRAPAAAHVEQPLPGLEAELATDQLQLGALRVGQGVVARGPVGTRVGHAGVQDELVEGGRQVVVAGDHGLVAGPAVPAAADAELAAGRFGWRAEDLQLSRCPGRGPGRRGQRDTTFWCVPQGAPDVAQAVGEVALEVEVAADVGAGQAELARPPEYPLQRPR